MPNIVAVVQARKNSSRLPGKVLLPLLGLSILERMLERLQKVKQIDRIVVATSDDPSDDAIMKLCVENNIDLFRGKMDDCLDRHYQCAVHFNADIVLKIPSDCPLIDPRVVATGIQTFLQSDADYCSNLHPATYPDGMDVEVMTMACLKLAHESADLLHEREHTTPYIWDRKNGFKIVNFKWETGLDYSMTHRLTIDYYEDYEVIKAIFERLYPVANDFSVNDIMTLQEHTPNIFEANKKYNGVNWYRHHLDDLNTISQDQTRFEQ